jgi:hypothetical protein
LYTKKPYGYLKIVKLKYVGQFQNQMGAQVRRPCRDMKEHILSDGHKLLKGILDFETKWPETFWLPGFINSTQTTQIVSGK